MWAPTAILFGCSSRRTRLIKYVICFVSWAALICSASAADRPNIILILADDLGYSDLGCDGGEIDTPSIDALAAGGVRLTQFYNSARCCPTRASLLTGLYPSQAGSGDFTTPNPSPKCGPGYLGRLNDHCVTLAEVLKPAGCGCYYVGKWYMLSGTGRPIFRFRLRQTGRTSTMKFISAAGIRSARNASNG
jgi:arylsulfatase A-like enzyme